MPPAAAKKNPSFGDLSNQSKKRNLSKERRGSGWVPGSKKNLKVPPLFGCSVITIIIYIPSFWKEDDDEDQGFVGDERAWGRRSLAPNRPGSSSFGLSREHARKRERERERKKKSASFRIEKKKRGKEGSDETTRGGAHPRIARAS